MFHSPEDSKRRSSHSGKHAEHLNMFVCSVFSLLLSLFPPRHNENIWQEVNSISTTFYRTGRVGLVVN